MRAKQVFSSKTAVECVGFLLRPVVRFCLRHSIRLQEFEELSKRVFVEEAKALFPNEENSSRIAVITGVHRKDLARFKRESTSPIEPRSLASRVLGAWDAKLQSGSEKERALSEEQFHALVRGVSSDVNPSSILFELKRVGAVAQNGLLLTLVRPTYVSAENTAESFGMAARDIDSLLHSVQHNVTCDDSAAHHHLTTEYDRIPADVAPQVQEWILREGHAFHARARAFISQFDLDLNPKPTKSDADRAAEVTVRVTSFGAVLEKGVSFPSEESRDD